MLEDVADEEYTVDGGSAARLVHLHLLFPQASSAVGRTASTRATWGIPMLRMTFERARGIFRARLGQIRDRLEQFGGWRSADVPEERDQDSEKRRENQQTPQWIDEDSIFIGDLVGQEDTDFWFEVKDTSDADTGADNAQADEMVLEMILGEIDGVVATADCRKHGDRR